MREALTEYENQLVLCKGWIDSWKDFEGSEIRQVCVKQPTIKVADKNLVFAEQKVIWTEHHINLFIPFEDLTEYKAQFQQHRTISFSGVVKRYTRKNGSTDYGIAAAPQHHLHLDFQRLLLALRSMGFPNSTQPASLHFLQHTAAPQLLVLEQRLEKAGNALPTFEYNYETYKEMIVGMKKKVEEEIKWLSDYLSSRDYRRKNKGRKSFMEELKGM